MYSTDEIKSRLSIFDICARLGIEIKGRGRLISSPFRLDKKPSFSISQNGQLFNDFATGEKGDLIDFYALATKRSKGDAIKELAEWAGLAPERLFNSKPTTYPRLKIERPTAQPEPERPRPKIPPLQWSDKGAKRLQDMRGYSIEGQRIAFERGVFGFCEYKGLPAWLVTDGAGRVAQARRVDGFQYSDSGAGHKAETLKNSDASTPAGIGAIGQSKYVALCEGSTDFLAAFHFAWVNDCENEVAPIAMLGAEQSISPDALETLRGKIVLIFPDADKAGFKGLLKWGNQIAPYAKVLFFKFDEFHRIDGEAVKDLSDFIALDPNEWETARPYTNPYFKLLQESI